MMRQPAVAGQFYPGNPNTLRQTIEDFLPEAPHETSSALAVISPHAGYIYSGSVAAQTFSQVDLPPTAIILGPNHSGMGQKAAVMDSGEWLMPFGTVPIDSNIAELLLAKATLLVADATAHTFEHSLEVQVPFMQYYRKLSIVPICLSQLSFAECLEIGKAIADVVSIVPSKPLLVASTDMSHYESRESATRKDSLAIDCIKKLDPEGLYNTVVANRITMCGFIPTTITLIAAKELGATSAKLIRYTDSGEVSGDTSQVVGYAGFIIS